MKLGIVGLPNVGKSTLFNAITNAGAQSANYPFCTIEPNVGVVAVARTSGWTVWPKSDEPDKLTPRRHRICRYRGLSARCLEGRGIGQQASLSHIREVDAVVHVVRCFDNDDIVHVEGSVDPARDIETINLELIFADMEMVERRIDRVSKMLKGDKKYAEELEVLKRLLAHLEGGRPARSLETTDEERELLKRFSLLSGKPVIYACNMSEEDFSAGITSNERVKQVEAIAAAEGAEVLPICAGMEADLAGMEEEEEKAFLSDLGLEQSGLDRLIQSCYRLLGLISYLTAGKPEVRAWTITRGTRAPQAAGKIHSDFERGFIRAEVIGYDEFMACGGSMTAAKEKGLVRSEGKEYVMQDGDIVLFRFNV